MYKYAVLFWGCWFFVFVQEGKNKLSMHLHILFIYQLREEIWRERNELNSHLTSKFIDSFILYYCNLFNNYHAFVVQNKMLL